MSYFADDWKEYGGGRKAPLGSLLDDELDTRLKNYKRLVAKRYRVVFPDNIVKFLPDGDLWISTKVDGELWFLVKREGEVALVAYNGRVLQGIPVVEEAAKHLENVDNCIVPGELFAIPQGTKSRPRVGHVATALHDDDLAKTLGFRAFDVLEFEGEDWLYAGYDKRYDKLDELFDGGKRCATVTTKTGDKAVAKDAFADWVESGKFEGLVVRTDQGITYKVKPFKTLDAVIVAFGERDNDGVTEMREMQVALLRDDGSFHLLGTVGGGFDEDARRAWHERLSELVVDSSFRLANREGTLCRFVKPEIVVEVKVSDLLDTDSRDMPVRRMTLEYDEASGYKPLGALPIVSLLHPVFVRERDDKEVDEGSVGLDQVFQHVPFDDRDATPTTQSFGKAEVVERRAFRKEMRGDNLGVRKYVAFKTNKEDNPEYAPFAVHFTDFSSGRKDPLKTDIRVAPTREKLQPFIDEWVEKNVKRGWEEVDA
jgi:hypothetical protein